AFSRSLAAGDLTKFPRPVGQARDFYGPNGNTFAIVIEVPSIRLTPAPNGIVGVWSTISRNGTQVSRMGRPLIDTALIPPVPRNDLGHGDLLAAFEAGQPSTDQANFHAAMVSVLLNPKFYWEAVGHLTAADANTFANLLLPD